MPRQTDSVYTRVKPIFEHDCGWFRHIPGEPDLQKMKYCHLIYGEITVYDAAKRDIREHNCRMYRLALRNLERN